MARMLIWVQSLLGTGHLRRMLLLAGALARRGHAPVLVNGGPPSPWPAPEGVALEQLEPLRAADAGFSAVVDAAGRPASEQTWGRRLARLEELTRRVAPDLVVVELFPFGRRAFARELLPWLATIRAQHPATVLVSSVRDVLVSKPRPERYEEMARLARIWFDLVVVHGDPSLVSFGESFPLVRTIQDRLRYTGYLVEPRLLQPLPGRARSGVVVSAGGGAVGTRLLEAAVAARRLCRARFGPWTLVGGANLPERARIQLERAAGDGVRLLGHDPDLPLRIAAAQVSVSQAGYNTVAETLAAGTPMVLVPFAAAGEDEQARRAARLAGQAFAEVVPEAQLDPEGLARAIDAAAQRPRPRLRVAIDDGSRAAALLAAAIGDGHR